MSIHISTHAELEEEEEEEESRNTFTCDERALALAGWCCSMWVGVWVEKGGGGARKDAIANIHYTHNAVASDSNFCVGGYRPKGVVGGGGGAVG